MTRGDKRCAIDPLKGVFNELNVIGNGRGSVFS